MCIPGSAKGIEKQYRYHCAGASWLFVVGFSSVTVSPVNPPLTLWRLFRVRHVLGLSSSSLGNTNEVRLHCRHPVQPGGWLSYTAVLLFRFLYVLADMVTEDAGAVSAQLMMNKVPLVVCQSFLSLRAAC